MAIRASSSVVSATSVTATTNTILASPRKKPDFNQITATALKRYKKAHKLKLNNTATTKSELVTAVAKHFAELPPPIDEDAIIQSFLEAVKQQKSINDPGAVTVVNNPFESGQRSKRRNSVKAAGGFPKL